jgi:hypothetical protein
MHEYGLGRPSEEDGFSFSARTAGNDARIPSAQRRIHPLDRCVDATPYSGIPRSFCRHPCGARLLRIRIDSPRLHLPTPFDKVNNIF